MKFTAILFLIALIVIGCGGDRTKVSRLEELNSQLQTENDILLKESAMKDEYIEEYTRTINEVYDNLERIRKREGFITKISKNFERHGHTPMRDKLLSNIQSIDNYIKQSKTKLTGLVDERRLPRYKKGLAKTIENLTRAIAEKEKDIVELRKQVDELSARMSEAAARLSQQNEIISKQAKELNTGFYIIGSKRDLKDKGVIFEEGGILGIGKARKVSANFDPEYFVSTDIMQTEVINIGYDIRGVQLVSPHSENSFHLVTDDEENRTYLEIIDPEEFWKMKYLVILTRS